MYLMLEDTAVLYFDLNDLVVEVIHNDLLPYYLRDRLNVHGGVDTSGVTGALGLARVLARNVQLVREYLSSRVLSLS